MADGIYQSVMCFFMPYFMYRPANFETMSGLNISDRTGIGCVVAACAILSTNFYVMFNSYKVNHKPPPTTATREHTTHDSSLGMDAKVVSQTHKSPVDAQSLQDLLARPGIVTRSLKETDRKAEGA